MKQDKLEIRTSVSKESYEKLVKLAEKYEMPLTTFVRMKLVETLDKENNKNG